MKLIEFSQNVKNIIQENKKYKFFSIMTLILCIYITYKILITPYELVLIKLILFLLLTAWITVTLIIQMKRFPEEAKIVSPSELKEQTVEILTTNPELTKELFQKSFSTAISSLVLGFIWFFLFAVSMMSCDSGCNNYTGYVLETIGLLYPIFIITSFLMWLFYFFKIKHEKALKLVLFTKKYSPVFMLSPILAVVLSFYFR